MANIDFSSLDQAFNNATTSNFEYSAQDTTLSGHYSFQSTDSVDVDFFGSGFTYGATFPTAGIVTGINIDPDNDDGFSTTEVKITGLDNIDLTDFDVGTGTAQEQTDRFWETALQGADTFDLTLSDFSVLFRIAGDGSDVADGNAHIGNDDLFVYGGSPLSNAGSWLLGDFRDISNGTAIGGNDIFNVVARLNFGDFEDISSGSIGFGGDDQIIPVAMGTSALLISGDASGVSGSLGGGDDLIDVRSMALNGFAGIMRLNGDSSSVAASGVLAGGDDTIHGSALADQIAGESWTVSGVEAGGNDQLFGYNGNDTIFGHGGSDLIDGGNDDDVLDGGTRRDTLRGGEGADSITGGGGNDFLDGGTQNDTMRGQSGDDRLFGQNGNDRMFGGSGSDTLSGGANSDIIRGEDDGDVERGNGGNDQLFGDLGEDSLFGDQGNDILNGGDGNDNLDGGVGNDILNGDANNDTLFGRDGNDRLFGGDGNDRIIGGANTDRLYGEAGNDTLTGGGGNDIFYFTPGGDEDEITDFTAGGTQDAIDLSAMGGAFNTLSEVLAATNDIGGNAVIDFGGGDTITLIGVTEAQLTASDFIF